VTGEPKFAAAELLVPEHDGYGFDELMEPGEEPAPGIRSQIAVADYNGDGKVDLLLGDFCTTVTPKNNLTAKERETMLAVYGGVRDAQLAVRRINEAARIDFCKRFPGDELFSLDAVAASRDEGLKMSESRSYRNLTAKAKTNIAEVLGPNLAKPPRPAGHVNDYCTCHGYVWLFLRK
jgi:hypothetical protein